MPSDEPYYRRSAPLDRNQAELLALMARGWSNSQIAASLDAPLPLVKSEVSRIIAALGASSREEAIEIWTHRRRRFSKSPALRGVLGVGIAGTFSVLAVAALVRGTSHVPQQPPELQGEAEEQVVGPPPATAPPLAHTAYCPSADPAKASYPWASAYDWIGFDGVTYVRQTQLAGSGPGKVAPSAVGQIYGLVNVDCPGTFLAPGQPLRTVGGYDPAFRLATEDGVIYEAVSREFADSVAGYFDLSSRVAAIVVRDPQNGAELSPCDLYRPGHRTRTRQPRLR